MGRRSGVTFGIVLSATAAVAAALTAQQQSEKEALFAFFAALGTGEWQGTGSWHGGGRFEQVHRYERAADGIVVKTQTLIPDSASGRLVMRAEGIRAWDEP